MYPACNSLINFQFLKEVLLENDLNKYIKYFCELKISKSDKYMNCANSCGNLIVKNNNRMNASVCFCGYSICNECHNEAHHPLNCKQYLYFKDEFEMGFEVNKVCMGKRCPGCRKFIEKNGGCNHMKCICGMQFCWRCLYPNTSNSHFACQEKATQPYIYLNKNETAFEKCLQRFTELRNYHKINIISYSKDYKLTLIDAVMKSKQKEAFRSIFINENLFGALVNLNDEKIFRKMIESAIDFFFDFIDRSREFHEKMCVAQHFNLKYGLSRKNLLTHVEKAIISYKKFYTIFNRPFRASSFLNLFFTYTKLLAYAKCVPKQ